MAQTLAAIATAMSVAASALMYFLEIPSRRHAAILGAWSTIAQTEQKHADAGRARALQQLVQSNESLAGLVLDGAILKEIQLEDVDLLHVSFRDLECSGCSFNRARLTKSHLEKGVYTQRCSFSGARFDDVVVTGANFADCNLYGTEIRNVVGDSKTSFNGASMIESTISNSNFPGTVFDNSDLTDAIAAHTHFENATFLRVTATRLRWTDVDASGATLSLAGVQATFTRQTILESAVFDNSDIPGAIFDGVHLSKARFFNAKLQGAVFRNCDLSGADFTSAHLEGAHFENCRMEGADIGQAIKDSGAAFIGCSGLVEEAQ